MSIFSWIKEQENDRNGKEVSVKVSDTTKMKVSPMRAIMQKGVTTKKGKQTRWVKLAPAHPRGQRAKRFGIKKR